MTRAPAVVAIALCTLAGSARPAIAGMIALPETTIALIGPASTVVSRAVAVEAVETDVLVRATITGPDATAFQLADAGCADQTCDLTLMPRTLPTTLTVTCTPAATPRTATLTVHGAEGAADTDSATLTCSTGSGGALAVSPTTVTATDVPVGAPSAPQPITITNTSNAPVTASVELDNPHWTVDACAAPASCTLQPGVPQTVHARLTPTAPGPDNGTLTVASSAGTATVMLLGDGVGARLRVEQPAAPYLLDFGTIGRNGPRTRRVRLAADGNTGLTVSVAAPSAPFAVSAPSVTLAAGGSGELDVSCAAATAGGPHQAEVVLDGDFYEADTTTLDVRCTIADTEVTVAPSELDFGEVRLGGGARTIAVTITNPGAPAMLQYVRLSAARTGLTLDAPAAQPLLTNVPVTATLALAPAADVVLDGVALEIGVHGVELTLPITGRVVTPKAHVMPAVLELGTACAGTAITGSVELVNDGSATLRVQPPVSDAAFTAQFLSPMTYPTDGRGAPLAPAESAIAGVTPSTSEPGAIRGTLTWDVDAPGAPFVVDVALEYIAEGTALSPRRLAFGSRPIDSESLQQVARLENCSRAPVRVTVRGVTAVHGSADAWVVSPRTLQTTLGPRDPLAISVRFAPRQPGAHVARIELAIDGERRFVELEGHATGAVDATTSFYGCGCAIRAPSPWQGLPLAAAVVVVLVPCRRRRRRRA